MGFKIGDRVVLISNKHIVPTQAWPVWNSKHECTGTVVGTMTERRYAERSVTKIRVQWDNGEGNTHLEKLLQHAADAFAADALSKEKPKMEPNRAFRRRKGKHRETIDGWTYKIRCLCGYEKYTSLSADMHHTIMCANCEGTGGFSIRSADPPRWGSTTKDATSDE